MTRKHLPVTPDEVAAANDPDALLAPRVTAALTGLSPLTLDRWSKAGRFPAPIYLTPLLKRYRAGQVRLWLQGHWPLVPQAASSIGVSETITGADAMDSTVSSESR